MLAHARQTNHCYSPSNTAAMKTSLLLLALLLAGAACAADAAAEGSFSRALLASKK